MNGLRFWRMGLWCGLYLASFALAWNLVPPVLPAASTRTAVLEAWDLGPARILDGDALALQVTAARVLIPAAPQGLPGLPGLPGTMVNTSPPLTPANWRIAAVLQRGQSSQLVLATQGEPDRLVSPGERLPGGAKLLSIYPDRVEILLHGRRLSLSTYPQ